jgi:hypothetical protein
MARFMILFRRQSFPTKWASAYLAVLDIVQSRPVDNLFPPAAPPPDKIKVPVWAQIDCDAQSGIRLIDHLSAHDLSPSFIPVIPAESLPPQLPCSYSQGMGPAKDGFL